MVEKNRKVIEDESLQAMVEKNRKVIEDADQCLHCNIDLHSDLTKKEEELEEVEKSRQEAVGLAEFRAKEL
jgi:hypothetical protein